MDSWWGATVKVDSCSGGHTDDFLAGEAILMTSWSNMDSSVEYLYTKFGEFSLLLLFNSV